MFEACGQAMASALDQLPDDPSSLADEAASEGFALLQHLSERLEAKRLSWLADQERRASFRKDGYLTAGRWLADRYGMTTGAASAQMDVAVALREMPETRAALVAGDVTVGAVRVMAQARREHPEAFAAQEAALVEAAQIKSVDELGRVVAAWGQAVDADETSQRAERLRQRRRLDLGPIPSGMVSVAGELDPESGEAVLTAIQAMVDAELRSGSGSDLRTPAQRRADALTELAMRYLGSPDRPMIAGERPHLTVTVSVDSLDGRTGMGELDHAGLVHPAMPRRLACDASLMRVVLSGPSEPLELGRRTAVVSASLRRAVVIRDRTCRFPRCTRPHAWCDAHHLKHWADGGLTDLSNLLLLCRPHHRLVHEGGFRLEMAEDGPRFRRPDGTVVEGGPSAAPSLRGRSGRGPP